MVLPPLLVLPLLIAAAPRPEVELAGLERRSGGVLGVSVLDTGTGRVLEHRATGRFPMCSTFKVVLVAAVLAEVEVGKLALNQTIPLRASDLVPHAPVCAARVGKGDPTLAELCEAALIVSDNTAANLLLRLVGGPDGLTAFARRHGDTRFRLDRIEPDLNEARPGDPRDTTEPRAMRQTLQVLLLGDALTPDSRLRLRTWMEASTTGLRRLRAALPMGWTASDKTGASSSGGVANHVALLQPPGRSPLLVAAFLRGATVDGAERDAILAEVGRLAVQLAQRP